MAHALVRLLVLAVALHLAAVPAVAQGGTLTVDGPPRFTAVAARIEAIELGALETELQRAGLVLPDRIAVTLIPEDDLRARTVPRWVVGLAFGSSNLAIFPDRVMPYPYDSIESVFRHEVAHLALDAHAAGRELPRWFHEGVAMSVDTGWGVDDRFRLLLEMARQPGTADLARLFASRAQPDAASAYGLSAALVADVRRRHGAGVPGAIAARVAGGTAFARAFAIETGETPDAAAARAWGAYVRWTPWVPALTSGSAVWTLILALAAAAWIARRRARARRRRRWDEEEEALPMVPRPAVPDDSGPPLEPPDGGGRYPS